MLNCPTADQLVAFLNSDASAAENDTIQEHVEVCAECEAQLGRLADDPQMHRWRETLRRAYAQKETVNQRVILGCLETICDRRHEPEPQPESLGVMVGSYILDEILGIGSFGTVYRAHDDHGNPWALKLLHPVRSEERSLKTLRREYSLRGVEHPGIVSAVHIGQSEDGRLYAVSEYVRGKSLKELLELGDISTTDGIAILIDVAHAVHEIHHADVFHRDLKPANIIVRDDGRPCVVDFGIALRESDQWDDQGEFAGSTAYMSPEQLKRKSQFLDGRSDVWSLGIILYEVCTGRLPFKASERGNLISEILERDPRPFDQLKDVSVDPEVEAVCRKALQKEPADRYLSAKAMADALSHALVEQEKLTGLALTDTTRITGETNLVELAEQAAYWKGTRSPDRLPNALSFLHSFFDTDRSSWTTSEREMMRAALVHHATRFFTRVLLTICVLTAGTGVYLGLKNRQRDEVVSRFGLAGPDEVPRFLTEFRRSPRLFEGRLRKGLKASIRDDDGQDAALRYSLALNESDPTQADYLCDRMINASVDEIPSISRLLFDGGALNNSRARKLLRDALESPGAGQSACFPLWEAPEPSTVRRIEKAAGRVATSFAFCQSLPIEKFSEVAESLRSAQYQPFRIRPYVDGQSVKLAAIWHRRKRDWKVELNLSPSDFVARNSTLSKLGLNPIDLSGYRDPASGEKRFAAIWIPQTSGEADTKVILDCELEDYRSEFRRLSEQGFSPNIQTAFIDGFGQNRISSLWAKNPGITSSGASYFVLDEGYPEYFRDLSSLSDLSACEPVAIQSLADRYTQQLTLALEMQVGKKDVSARFMEGRALFYLGRFQESIEALTEAVESPKLRSYALPLRAVALARTRRKDEAFKDLGRYLELSSSRRDWHERRKTLYAVLEAKVKLYSGEIDFQGFENAIEEIASHGSTDAKALFSAACAFAGASDSANKDEERTRCLKRAIDLVERTLHRGLDPARVFRAPDLAPLWNRFFQKDPNGALSYCALWNDNHAATKLFIEMDPSKQIVQSRLAETEGFLPTSLSLVRGSSGERLESSSIWSKQQWMTENDDEVARRVNAALSLIRLNDDQVWQTLHGESDSYRSDFVHRCLLFGVGTQELIEQLSQHKDPNVISTLLSCLGEYSWDDLPDSRRDELQTIVAGCVEHADPAVHSVAKWVLGRWGQAVDGMSFLPNQDGYDDLANEKRWWVNSIGQTMIKFQGPTEYFMGSPANERYRVPLESTKHGNIDYSFAIADTETTEAQFSLFDPERMDQKELNVAARKISWFKAAAFCNWLTEHEGLGEENFCYEPNEQGVYGPGMTVHADVENRFGYRLPAETEWELVCRAGTTGTFAHGESMDLLSRYAFYGQNSNRMIPAASLRPNGFGVFDMLGGVLEWTHTPWQVPGRRLPPSMKVFSETMVPARGGSYALAVNHARCASRLPIPARATKQHGFRVVRTLNLKPTRNLSNATSVSPKL